MPTYEYECTKCSHHFERFQNMTDEPLKRCPQCRCKIKRLIGTGAGIIFKGSGFYETDYRTQSYADGKKKEESSKKSSKPSGGKKDKKKEPVSKGKE